MARKGFQATVSTPLATGEVVMFSAGSGAAKQESVTGAALAAAIATAVADGASPTQAHVTAISVAYAALAVDNSGDVALTYDTTAVTSTNQLKWAMDAIWRQIQGSGV